MRSNAFQRAVFSAIGFTEPSSLSGEGVASPSTRRNGCEENAHSMTRIDIVIIFSYKRVKNSSDATLKVDTRRTPNPKSKHLKPGSFHARAISTEVTARNVDHNDRGRSARRRLDVLGMITSTADT